jgi:predicted amidohydrolase YtcJ
MTMTRPASLAALALILAAGTARAAVPADIVFWGGPIYTAVDAHPTAEAVAVSHDRIVFVGDRAGAAGLVGPKTRVIDLHGAALFPGFTDSHVHLSEVGFRELTLNLEGSKSVVEVQGRLKAWLASHPGAGPVFGRGWIETGWPEHRFLTAADLDAVAGDRIVLLQRADGHAIVGDTAALKAAGVTAATSDPFGGHVIKDDQGQPAGMLVDNAMDYVAKLLPKASPAELRAAFDAGFAVEARYGWTGLHAMSVSWPEVELLESMDRAGEAPLRVYNAVDLDQAGPLFASGPRATPDGRITTRAIKLYADGALGSRGAALFSPYADAPNTTGLMKLKPDETAPVLARAMAKGIQVCTHAIGDKANHVMLDLYEQALKQAPAANHPGEARWRIEHAQNLIAGDIPRFRALGVIASMQPSHAIGDLHFAGERLGMERLSEAYDWKSLVDSGAVVVGGSDAPVERGDPLIEFYAAVARKDLKGYSGPGWHPEQAVDRATALKMFTAWPAYARFAEQDLGVLEAGKRADLTAFSVDLMTAPEAEIPKAHAVLTVVDGRIVYAAPEAAVKN